MLSTDRNMLHYKIGTLIMVQNIYIHHYDINNLLKMKFWGKNISLDVAQFVIQIIDVLKLNRQPF